MSSTIPPQTPPHQPLHGVRMSAKDISNLLETLNPGSTVVSVAQLPSGQSFNNRIYHIKIDRGRTLATALSHEASSEVDDLVFKLSGRFFRSDKIQNEVACLRLMEIHCPEVPAPRVRAWSEGGRTLVRITPDGDACDSMGAPALDLDEYNAGWILMTRVPGELLVPEEWDQPAMSTLAHQLADMVASWRREIPAIRHSGNLLFCDQESSDLSLAMGSKGSDFPATKAQGLIGVPVDAAPRAERSASLVEYYQMRLESALYEAETVDVYAPNRHLGSVIRGFAAETLPRLTLHSGPGAPEERAFVFTHGDLFPRNILVSGNPPRITGIVDYEFSGFFPETEEFVNEFVGGAGNWPQWFIAAYHEKLESLGVATPSNGIDRKVWARIIALDRLIAHIAPWWLAGQRSEAVLRDALKDADEVVRQKIAELENSLDS